jgi:2'-5' RNA ligase
MPLATSRPGPVSRPARRSYATEAQIHLNRVDVFLDLGDVDAASEALRPVFRLPPDRRLVTLTRRVAQVGRALTSPQFARSPAATGGGGPDGRSGGSFYTWHLTFEDAPDVMRLVRQYNAHLGLPGRDTIPDRWLHLTMQGIRFMGDVDQSDVDKIVAAAVTRSSTLAPFTVALGPTVVDPEVVRLEVHPAESVARLRLMLRAAIAEVWGIEQVPDDEDDFIPHVSLAYSNRDGDMRPILAAASAVTHQPGEATISHADLILLNRDHRQYEWTTYARGALGR